MGHNGEAAPRIGVPANEVRDLIFLLYAVFLKSYLTDKETLFKWIITIFLSVMDERNEHT
ncbi:hypothetical protein A6F57_12595 [Alteromonas stellipolaris]|nr:hypothetical protein AV939_02715 [Alteromonas sp. Mac1]ANB25959.1 hypothetical protein A6F57_12595 [Alteromonas stellipolaris]